MGIVPCMYTTIPDQHFVLRLHPGHKNVIVVSPCSGHGFKFASVIGEILADLTTEVRTNYPNVLFSPARFAQ
jgi:sarcosine oxidase